jgi:hypothetical protein
LVVEEENSNQETEEQSKFHAGHSYTDNLFCLKQIIEEKIISGRDLHMLFIDLMKYMTTYHFKCYGKT